MGAACSSPPPPIPETALGPFVGEHDGTEITIHPDYYEHPMFGRIDFFPRSLTSSEEKKAMASFKQNNGDAKWFYYESEDESRWTWRASY